MTANRNIIRTKRLGEAGKTFRGRFYSTILKAVITVKSQGFHEEPNAGRRFECLF